ncbi:MAG: hypothetical protein AVDCRST_MAG49-4397 [uncultured Thermomicrobiales bacterium]|uniref:Acyl-peptide hydrolase n=1 Tax=uncultured Thermomicrobiales bacterium TaxID=1645740 RepID=A0A6J4VF17_9BACT|nr:MAG: hypothetical protein AVDCRST_MAG49-4397 [uncultured Thermomicrobiales bacterium]
MRDGQQDGRLDPTPYFAVPAATTPAWLSGGRLAFLWDRSGVPQVWLREPGTAEPRQLTDFPDRIGTLAATPGGDRLLFGMDRGGDERHQLWSVAVDQPAGDGAAGAASSEDAPRARPLTADPAAIHRLGPVAADGRRLAFSANGRDHRFFDVLLLGLDDPAAVPTLALAHDELLEPVAFAPDGRLLVHRANTNLDGDLFLVPADGGPPRHLTPHEGEASFHHSAFEEGGDGVLLVSNRDRDRAVLARIDLTTGEETVLAEDPDWEVEAVAVVPDGDCLAYTVNVDGASRLALRDIGSGEERAVTGLPPGVVDGLVWSPEGDRLAFSLSGATDPSAVWSCGRDGVARRETPVDLGTLDAAALVAPETIRYPTFDGRSIPALWFQPPGPGPFPVVVEVHGGPESQRRPAFAPITQYLLGLGFAVLAPNVRGSTGYGKAYCHLDDIERRPDAVADLAAANAWLRRRPDVDPARLAVMGQSYGGFMVLAALTTQPDLWAVGVDVVGIADFATFLANTGPWRRETRAAEYGDPVRDAATLRAISPLHRADRIAVPLLVIHGRNDPRVPLSEAEQIVAAIRGRGGEVELHVFDDEGHGLVKRANRVDGYGAVGAFLRRLIGED